MNARLSTLPNVPMDAMWITVESADVTKTVKKVRLAKPPCSPFMLNVYLARHVHNICTTYAYKYKQKYIDTSD